MFLFFNNAAKTSNQCLSYIFTQNLSNFKRNEIFTSLEATFIFSFMVLYIFFKIMFLFINFINFCVEPVCHMQNGLVYVWIWIKYFFDSICSIEVKIEAW